MANYDWGNQKNIRSVSPSIETLRPQDQALQERSQNGLGHYVRNSRLTFGYLPLRALCLIFEVTASLTSEYFEM